MVRPLDAALEGGVRLGAFPTIAPYLLPRLLSQLHWSHPALKLVIQDATSRDLIEDLRAGRHDLIPTRLPSGDEDLQHWQFFLNRLALLLRRITPWRKETIFASLTWQERSCSALVRHFWCIVR